VNRFTYLLKLMGLLLLLGGQSANLYAASDDGNKAVKAGAKKIVPNKVCIRCHSDEDEKVETMDDGTEVFIYVDDEKFEESVHGKQNCVGCHTNITKKYHQEQPTISVSCVQCHEDEWNKQQKGEGNAKYERLDVVMKQIDSYMHSVHARPSRADQSRTNATCT